MENNGIRVEPINGAQRAEVHSVALANDTHAAVRLVFPVHLVLCFRDLRRAITGAQRAYHCLSFAPNLLNEAWLLPSP